MKKSLIASMAVALLALSANAASIQWTVSGLASKVLKDKQGNVAADTTIYFILASENNLATLSGHETQSEFETALQSLTLSTATTTSEGKKPSITKREVTNNALTAGTQYTFGILAYSKDAEGNGYYAVATASNFAYDASDPTSAKEVQTSFATLTSAAYTSAWVLQEDPGPGPGPDDPTPGVPEPATGALALAGVALLFKRRRA